MWMEYYMMSCQQNSPVRDRLQILKNGQHSFQPRVSNLFSPGTLCFLRCIFQMPLCSSTSDSNTGCQILQHLLNFKFNSDLPLDENDLVLFLNLVADNPDSDLIQRGVGRLLIDTVLDPLDPVETQRCDVCLCLLSPGFLCLSVSFCPPAAVFCLRDPKYVGLSNTFCISNLGDLLF